MLQQGIRRAKIVCTLGPASNKPEVLKEMIQAGLDVARLNFSHGAHADHRAVYQMVRHISHEVGRPVAILQDLQGPKIRVGKFKDGGVELIAGKKFCITAEDLQGNAERVSTTYKELPRDVHPGDQLLLDDGLLALRVLHVKGEEVWTEVEIGGTLKNNKGINLPNSAVSAPSMTTKDKEDLKLGLELGVDYVALSFVRSALDIHMLQALMAGARCKPLIIAKIEKPQAISELGAIIDVADGIMIARGDLGVELPPEKVPMIQKQGIRQAMAAGKITITATQMLESMTQNPRPTRAEASDVANAIMDGTDAVMLSGETASGKYPVRAVEMMARIVSEVENSPHYKSPSVTGIQHDLRTFPNAAARGATVAADELGVQAIVAFTESGRTARLLTAYRPRREIIACSPNLDVVRKLALCWGISPFLINRMDNTDDMIVAVERLLRKERVARPGDEVIIVMGTPVGAQAETNLIKFHRLGMDGDAHGIPQSRW
jgi:pyruvate kinase